MPKIAVDLSDEDYLKLESLSRIHGEEVERIICNYVAEGIARHTDAARTDDSTGVKLAYAQARRAAVPRISELGLFGERVAVELLEKHAEFSDVKPLNERIKHHPFADVFAVRRCEGKEERLVISVKTRNKYTNQLDKDGNPRLNGKYNILPKAQALAIGVAQEYRAKAAWIAVQVDAVQNAYSCYFGYLDNCWGNGIHMREEDTKDYVCLAKDEPCPTSLRHLHNLD